MSKAVIICEVSEVRLSVVSRTAVYAKSARAHRVQGLYMTVYTGLYAMLYMYAKSGRFAAENVCNYRQFRNLVAFPHDLVALSRNLANERRNLAKSRGYISRFGRNLATDLLKALEKCSFARLARLGLWLLRIRELYVHPCTRTCAYIGG